jgi:hypothetical protein
MEPISAIDVFTAMNPAHATRYSQMKPAVPPLSNAMIDVLPEVRSADVPWKEL